MTTAEWPAPATVEHLQDAMSSLGHGYLLASAHRSDLAVSLYHAPGYHPEDWTILLELAQRSAGLKAVPERWRAQLAGLGWAVLGKPRRAKRATLLTKGRRWVVNGQDDVATLHGALVDALSVGAPAIETPIQLNLSTHPPVEDVSEPLAYAVGWPSTVLVLLITLVAMFAREAWWLVLISGWIAMIVGAFVAEGFVAGMGWISRTAPKRAASFLTGLGWGMGTAFGIGFPVSAAVLTMLRT